MPILLTPRRLKNRDNVYRSEFISNNLNPEWNEVTLELSDLCGGDLDCPLQVKVFDREKNGKHDPMGSLETSVNGLVAAAKSGNSMQLTNEHKKSGNIVVEMAEVSGMQQLTQRMQEMAVSAGPKLTINSSPPPPASRATFVDYISGGCELNVVVAIDFTGSNGDPRVPGALHYIDANSRNQYEQAMAAIVSILLKYDSDQMIPVVGFGAKYGGAVRHCFQCGPTAEVKGLNGVMDAYNAVFRSLQRCLQERADHEWSNCIH